MYHPRLPTPLLPAGEISDGKSNVYGTNIARLSPSAGNYSNDGRVPNAFSSRLAFDNAFGSFTMPGM